MSQQYESTSLTVPSGAVDAYRERLLEFRRDLLLYRDRIHISGKVYFRRDFEAPISLAGLEPDYAILRMRQRSFTVALLLMGGGLLGAYVGYASDRHYFSPAVPGGLVLAVAGAVLGWITRRKITFVRFRNRQGLLVLDIGDSGPDAGRFDQFVKNVQLQIIQSRDEVALVGPHIHSVRKPVPSAIELGLKDQHEPSS